MALKQWMAMKINYNIPTASSKTLNNFENKPFRLYEKDQEITPNDHKAILRRNISKEI